MAQTDGARRLKISSPIETHAPAFLAFQMTQLTDRITSAGTRFTSRLGLDLPVYTMSTIMVLRRHPATVTEIAAALNVSHVAGIKSTKALIARGLVMRTDDPEDGRRKPLSLTEAGSEVAPEVEAILEKAQAAYHELFDEIGINLHDAVVKMNIALNRKSFDDRLVEALRR